MNACVGRQLPQNLGDQYYSDGFRTAARALVDQMAEGSTLELPVDLAVYPVVFLYRHHLELLLKLLIRAGHRFLREGAEWPKGHSVKALWSIARPLVENCFQEADRCQNDTASTLFAELDGLDPNGEAARYMLNQKGNKHFAELWILNVRHFADVAERLSDYLTSVLSGIEITDEQRREWEREMVWHGE